MKDESKYDCLKLGNQLCFPLYAVSKEIIRHYKPLLDALDLTYTQYITMMVLWENKSMNVKELGEHLFLDSGTLTPVLKKMESKGYITRTRMSSDERNVLIEITDEGLKLRDRALSIPEKMAGCVNLSQKDGETLYHILHKIMQGFIAENKDHL